MVISINKISRFALRAFVLSTGVLLASGCAFKIDNNPTTTRQPIAAYCPYIASPKSYTPSMTVTGHAVYEYRIDGNGIIPDGTNAYTPTVPASGATTVVGISLNGTPLTYSCSSPCTVLKAVKGLADQVTSVAFPGISVTYNMTAFAPYRSSGTGAITLTSPSNMTALNANPIRYAEVQVTNDAGTIVQCAETNATGDFSLALPSDGVRYNVTVLSRSSNANNTGYVMTNPNDNVPYKLTTPVISTTSTSVSLRAIATGTLEGGAFNILDQVANAQAYLRAQTAGCNVPANPNYFAGCVPVTTVPIVNAYWSAGVSPSIYYGGSATSGISYYLNGVKELYILGGINGDTKVTDMDHFDNSVIVHEYGHFIEDQFAKPNSPGGSHSGNSIIDPRLAWGEGWANYFQAAVSGIPVYRDTSGYVCASGCSTAVSFKQPLETGTQFTMTDVASATGEGNFHEFSVARLLWAISKPSGTSQFSEIWTAFNGSNSMRTSSDPFKSIGRLHVLHNAIASAVDWTTPVTNEKQSQTLAHFGQSIDVSGSCSTATSNTMNILVTGSDNGSFASSNQFVNNDFYAVYHPGGTFTARIDWSGSARADLDLYIYKAGYTFGDSTSIVGQDAAETGTTSGAATVSKTLAAGYYMINVMGYTGGYTSTGTYPTSYTLSVGGHAACPIP